MPSLVSYIPIGCLKSSMQFPAGLNTDTWQFTTDTSRLCDYPDQFIQGLQKLMTHDWVRMSSISNASTQIFRVYVLSGNIGQRHLDQLHKTLSRALRALVSELDVSAETWNGFLSGTHMRFDLSAAADEGSLYWIFNTLPSPAPSAASVQSYFHRKAVELLLDPNYQLVGLRTALYPYQRRAASLMIQREGEVKLELDPRLEQRAAPDGSTYFYAPRGTVFSHLPQLYETSKGGILAETMGLGKTLICIALLLSTKGIIPKTPHQYETVHKRPKTGSLVEMTVSAINRNSAPWKPFFEQFAALTGEHMTECIKLMRQSTPSYEIPPDQTRRSRNSVVQQPRVMLLAATTLIVVPRNLLLQWQSELEKHVEENSLNVLVMDHAKKNLPSPQELVEFDLILFSRPRFEQESKDGTDSKGRRMSRNPVSCNCPYIGATRTRDCTCLQDEDLYDSPLKHVHFLRMIIDEGHFFSSSTTQAARVANDIVCADHRWVVTGTPAKGLLGAEMEIASGSTTLPDEARRHAALEKRREFSLKEDISGATKSIGDLVSHYLKVQPWKPCNEGRPAEWKADIFSYKDTTDHAQIVGFSKGLRNCLSSIVIKTRPEDVDRDIELPPLIHRTVRLKPSTYDKLTANTFAFVLAANAVTSERSDADYLFHPSSRKDRNRLVENLRQSAFAWTGFSRADVEATIKISEGYLSKKDTSCNREDRALLTNCVRQGKRMLALASWRALNNSHEVGLSVADWPEDSASFWSFNHPFDGSQPILCGVTQLLKAQSYINNRTALANPSEGLSGEGLRTLSHARFSSAVSDAERQSALTKSGIPSSSIDAHAVFHQLPGTVNKTISSSLPESPQELPAASTLRETRIVGTTSAKLSYLISQIDRLHHDEKILVFYDSDDAAYYLAQALDLLHVGHFIYAKGLSAAKKSEYIVQFDKDSRYRVLLMDVGQAAFGLNVPSASRVFFLNPVCHPHVEAQAIKRAHRIGQTRSVVVETLVLKGTVEERMFERSKRMTRAEHNNAKMLDDDGGIKSIIQDIKPVPISDEELTASGQTTLLDKPQQLWSRQNWVAWKKMENEVLAAQKGVKRDARAVEEAGSESSSGRPTKRQTAASRASFVGSTDPSELDRTMDIDADVKLEQ